MEKRELERIYRKNALNALQEAKAWLLAEFGLQVDIDFSTLFALIDDPMVKQTVRYDLLPVIYQVNETQLYHPDCLRIVGVEIPYKYDERGWYDDGAQIKPLDYDVFLGEGWFCDGCGLGFDE